MEKLFWMFILSGLLSGAVLVSLFVYQINLLHKRIDEQERTFDDGDDE